ncbi:MAG: type 4a pilus biogenesis protein PilO [Deltaproteobacteria bacterium]|nr:type 4a pilus biogenesis protein PilO [Deltaproteobacteria bacterium]
MAAMDDFNRLPRQQKILLFVVAGMLLGALYWQFRFKPLKQSVEDADAQHQQKITLSKKLDGDIPKFEALKAQMPRLKRLIDENQTALPSEAELPAFFDLLNRKVTESGVQVTYSRRMQEEPVENFVKVPIEIEMTGTFMQIKKFFASLAPKKKRPGEQIASSDNVEERERPVSIEHLAITTPVVKNHEIVLTAKFTMTTYRKEEPGAPAGNGATLQKPMAPSAPKPLPSAATPAGAKARVENSLDKGDDRNRNATGVDEAKTPSGAGSARMKGGL